MIDEKHHFVDKTSAIKISVVSAFKDEHRKRFISFPGDHNYEFRLHGEHREFFSKSYLFGHISVSLVLLVSNMNGIIKKAFY